MLYFDPSTLWIHVVKQDNYVPITEAERDELMQGQENGMQIAADADGRPYLRPIPVTPPMLPQRVLMFQARAALIEAGLDDAVEAALAAMPAGKDKKLARAAWEYAAYVERYSSFTVFLAGALGLSDAKVDELFTAAANIN